jgi:hypothetical protein
MGMERREEQWPIPRITKIKDRAVKVLKKMEYEREKERTRTQV